MSRLDTWLWMFGIPLFHRMDQLGSAHFTDIVTGQAVYKWLDPKNGKKYLATSARARFRVELDELDWEK